VHVVAAHLDVFVVPRRRAHAVAAVVRVRVRPVVAVVRVDDRGVAHDVGAGGGGRDIDDFD